MVYSSYIPVGKVKCYVFGYKNTWTEKGVYFCERIHCIVDNWVREGLI